MENNSICKSAIEGIHKKLHINQHIDLASCTQNEEGLLEVAELVYVPNDIDPRRRIISSRHCHSASNYPSQVATSKLISRDFWWPNMRKKSYDKLGTAVHTKESNR